MKHLTASFSIVAALLGASFTSPGDDAPTLRVFLLVGQSNMEGKGAIEHLDALLADEATAPTYAHLKQGEEWRVRDDVWISYQHGENDDRKGGLSVGYGSRPNQIGPELGFGSVIGDALEEDVLLIKCAWGGASLKADFLPPSAGGPGAHYTRMLSETRAVLDDLGGRFPALAEHEVELAGLVWFQGWNDAVGGGNPDYTEQLAAFVRDVRAELDAPALPVVIGELGQAGDQDVNANTQAFRDQQAAVAALPEFEGSVAFVRTAPFIDPVLHEQFQIWRRCSGAARRAETDEAKEAAWADWRAVEAAYAARTSDRPYHYFGSGEVFYAMGDAFGRGMLPLLGLEAQSR